MSQDYSIRSRERSRQRTMRVVNIYQAQKGYEQGLYPPIPTHQTNIKSESERILSQLLEDVQNLKESLPFIKWLQRMIEDSKDGRII